MSARAAMPAANPSAARSSRPRATRSRTNSVFLSSRHGTDVDSLAAGWCVALDAGRASIDAAGLYLKSDELAVHSRRLEEDRAEAIPLLAELARDQHRTGLLARWLATPRHTRAM